VKEKSIEVSEHNSELDKADCLVNFSKTYQDLIHDMKSELFLEQNNNSMKENANILTVIGEKHDELEEHSWKLRCFIQMGCQLLIKHSRESTTIYMHCSRHENCSARKSQAKLFTKKSQSAEKYIKHDS
jgi:hypothetical protein